MNSSNELAQIDLGGSAFNMRVRRACRACTAASTLRSLSWIVWGPSQPEMRGLVLAPARKESHKETAKSCGQSEALLCTSCSLSSFGGVNKIGPVWDPDIIHVGAQFISGKS